jgi:hopanoid biosynthesis associated protein HpnK
MAATALEGARMNAPPITLVVTADDFGASVEVNEAVEESYRRGILTAASLMVAGRATEDAVRRARRLPGLGVGLHLALVDEAPVLPAAEIPDLVDAGGRLCDRLVVGGARIALLPRVRRQAEREIEAQFEAFRRTGVPLDHVNGHHHYHQHPVAVRMIVALAEEYRVPAVRIPYEPFRAAWRARRRGYARRFLSAAAGRFRAERIASRLDRAGIAHNDAMFGLHESGRMTREVLLDFLRALPPGIDEIYSHPATARWSGPGAPPDSYDPVGEFAALVDPDVVAAANHPMIRRVSFSQVHR